MAVAREHQSVGLTRKEVQRHIYDIIRQSREDMANGPADKTKRTGGKVNTDSAFNQYRTEDIERLKVKINNIGEDMSDKTIEVKQFEHGQTVYRKHPSKKYTFCCLLPGCTISSICLTNQGETVIVDTAALADKKTKLTEDVWAAVGQMTDCKLEDVRAFIESICDED